MQALGPVAIARIHAETNFCDVLALTSAVQAATLVSNTSQSTVDDHQPEHLQPSEQHHMWDLQHVDSSQHQQQEVQLSHCQGNFPEQQPCSFELASDGLPAQADFLADLDALLPASNSGLFSSLDDLPDLGLLPTGAIPAMSVSFSPQLSVLQLP